MYTQQDIDDLTRQLRRQTALWLIPETILLAGVILCFESGGWNG